MATSRTRTFITVNGEQILLTNALALELALDALRGVDVDPLVVQKLVAHLATLRKPSGGERKPSEAAMRNRAYAAKLAALMPEGEDFTLEVVADHLRLVGSDGKASKQKAYQVVKVLIGEGRAIKIDGRPVKYRLV